MDKMQFTLFSKISFEVSDPIALIESFCFQSNFYKNYDLLLRDEKKRTAKNANKIGARIKEEFLEECKSVVDKSRKLKIFDEHHNDLDSFLELNEGQMKMQLKELNEKVIQKLLKDGIGFSKATKILHTCYPELVPIIDKPLQDEYKKQVNSEWDKKQADLILFDFYKNLKIPATKENLNEIAEQVNYLALTKIRIFDILWWSYLKAKNLKEKYGINWKTIKVT